MAYAIHDKSGVRILSVPGIQPHLGAVFEGTAINLYRRSQAMPPAVREPAVFQEAPARGRKGGASVEKAKVPDFGPT